MKNTATTPPEKQLHLEADREERITRFLALDKCVRGRDFIQVVEIPINAEYATDSHVRTHSYDFVHLVCEME